MSLFQNKN